MPTLDDVARVRLLASDTAAPQAFTDDQLQAFLDLNAGAVRLAAADALENLAGQLLTVDSDEIKVDGSKQAATLLARATALREQHYLLDEGTFIVVPGRPF